MNAEQLSVLTEARDLLLEQGRALRALDVLVAHPELWTMGEGGKGKDKGDAYVADPRFHRLVDLLHEVNA